MGQTIAFSVALMCVASSTALTAQAQTAPDPVGKLALFGAAFAQNGAQPQPEKVTAMAFLPGRGVISWDITGKTSQEAREAQIEAMGLADARAVQREIDQAAPQHAEDAPSPRIALLGGSTGGRAGLALPNRIDPAHEGGAVLSLNHTPRRDANILGVKSGDTVKGKPRMYAFAAASGRSVGLNVLQDDAGWKNAGLTTDRDGLVGQQQAGLAWRKGLVQTSVSYIQEKDWTQILGAQSGKDHRVMLTLNMPTQAILQIFAEKP